MKLTLAAALFGSTIASASGLNVAPTRLELSAGTPAAALALRNVGGEEVLIQAELALWTQERGVDGYEPSSDLVVSPPIFTLEPGAEQIVRVGLRGAPTAAGEAAYRLFLTRVPEAEARAGSEGVRFALRLAVPVFVRPAVPVAPCLEGRLAGGTSPSLTLLNRGTAHVQVMDLAVSAPDGGRRLASGRRAFYLLPGARTTVELEAEAPPAEWTAAGELRLDSRTDLGRESARLLALPPASHGEAAVPSSWHFRPGC